MHDERACNKVHHGSPKNQPKKKKKTLLFCKIGPFKAQLICLILNALHNKAKGVFLFLVVQCIKMQLKTHKWSKKSGISDKIIYVKTCAKEKVTKIIIKKCVVADQGPLANYCGQK